MHVARIAQKNGIKVRFSDEAAHTTAKALMAEVREQGLAKAQAKLDTRAKLFDLLMKTTLGNGVTYDEASFAEALGKTSNGAKFRDGHGNIYGFVDGEGVLHFNPAAINFNTPIHEYGHLALEAMKKLDNGLWKRGMELVRKSKYFEEIKKYSETEGHEYGYLKGSDEGICDEALATLIGDRGERLVLDKGVGTELKAWLKAFWRKFKGTFGLADLTDEQMERMTVEEFVDAVNAELLRGSEFGVRRRKSGLSRSDAAKLRERKREDQHYADEAEREEFEAGRAEQSSAVRTGADSLTFVETPKSAASYKEAREILRKETGKKFTNAGSGLSASLSGNSISKILSGKAVAKSVGVKQHLAAAANIVGLFEGGELRATEEGNRKGVKNAKRVFARFDLDGEKLVAKITVLEHERDDHRIYSVEAMEVSKAGSILAPKDSKSQAESPALPSSEIISNSAVGAQGGRGEVRRSDRREVRGGEGGRAVGARRREAAVLRGAVRQGRRQDRQEG